MRLIHFSSVIAGPDPAIHPLQRKRMDPRVTDGASWGGIALKQA
jgi:hypothetical protein